MTTPGWSSPSPCQTLCLSRRDATTRLKLLPCSLSPSSEPPVRAIHAAYRHSRSSSLRESPVAVLSTSEALAEATARSRAFSSTSPSARCRTAAVAPFHGSRLAIVYCTCSLAAHSFSTRSNSSCRSCALEFVALHCCSMPMPKPSPTSLVSASSSSCGGTSLVETLFFLATEAARRHYTKTTHIRRSLNFRRLPTPPTDISLCSTTVR